MTQPRIDHREEVRPGQSISETTIDGVSVFAFNVRPGDVQDWDRGNIGPNQKPNERAEISYAPAPGPQKVNSPYNVKEGMLQTYDVDYRFAAGFPAHVAANHEWAVLTQFHPQDDHRAGVPHGFGGVTAHDGHITFDDPMGSGNYFARIPIKTDTWFKLRMAVRWSAKADGYAKIVDRATGALIGRYDGPTITAGEYKYLKQGYYRAGGLPEATVYQTWIDVREGDLTETTPAPAPTTTTPPPAPGATTASVQEYAACLIQTRNAMQKQIEVINGLLGKP